jgi:hypothetical protein
MITNSIQLVYTKIRVHSEQDSIRIQNRAFDIGFFWPGRGQQKPVHTDKPFLYFGNIYIDAGNDQTGFNEAKSYEEITIVDIFGDEPAESILVKEQKLITSEFISESQSALIAEYKVALNEAIDLAKAYQKQIEDLEKENIRLNKDFSEEIRKHNNLSRSANALMKALRLYVDSEAGPVDAYQSGKKAIENYFYLIS